MNKGIRLENDGDKTVLKVTGEVPLKDVVKTLKDLEKKGIDASASLGSGINLTNSKEPLEGSIGVNSPVIKDAIDNKQDTNSFVSDAIKNNYTRADMFVREQPPTVETNEYQRGGVNTSSQETSSMDNKPKEEVLDAENLSGSADYNTGNGGYEVDNNYVFETYSDDSNNQKDVVDANADVLKNNNIELKKDEKTNKNIITINPEDSIKTVMEKLTVCKSLGIEVSGNFQGIEVDTKFTDPKDFSKQFYEKIRKDKDFSGRGIRLIFDTTEKKHKKTQIYLEIDPNDTLDDILEKLAYCQRKGIKVIAVFNGIEISNYHSMYFDKNAVIGYYCRELNRKMEQSQENIVFVPGKADNEVYIKTSATDTVEEVISKLNKCRDAGIKANAIIDGVVLDNYSFGDDKQRYDFYQKYATPQKNNEDVERRSLEVLSSAKNQGLDIELLNNKILMAAPYINKLKVDAKNDTVDTIAKKLEFLKNQGFLAQANYKGINLDNSIHGSAKDIIDFYYKEQEKNNNSKKVEVYKTFNVGVTSATALGTLLKGRKVTSPKAVAVRRNKLVQNPAIVSLNNGDNVETDNVTDSVKENEDTTNNTDSTGKKEISDNNTENNSDTDKTETGNNEPGNNGKVPQDLAGRAESEKDIKGKGELLDKLKRLLLFLKMHPLLAGFVITTLLVLVFLMFIMFLYTGSKNDNKGHTGLNGYDYIEIENKCENIYVTGSEYEGLYPLEEYVAGVVNAEVGGMTPIYDVYAITARTYALNRLKTSSDCSIDGTSKAQVFRPTENEDIITATNNTRGLVLTKDGALFSSEYDAFCWSSKSDNYYTIQNGLQVPTAWVEEHIHNRYYKNCQCNLNNPSITECWVDGTWKDGGHGRGMSQWGAYYLATERAYTKEDIFSYFYGDDVKIMSIYESASGDDYAISPDAPDYKNLKFLVNQPLSSMLLSHGSSVETLNGMLKESATSAGVGTRKAVVNSAMTLIGTLAQYGYKLPYQWGGKYYKIGVNPSWGNVVNTNCGDYNYNDRSVCYNNYKWVGFDCSGFVNWTLINGLQVDYSGLQAKNGVQYTDFSRTIPLSENEAVCNPGDVLVNNGHIALVVGIEDSSKNYIVAESAGSRIADGTGGVIISRWKFKKGDYKCRKLDYLYNGG